ncbi:MAG TPA: hypothetical protein VF342_12000 [Alphaproteobacteria bacterium]
MTDLLGSELGDFIGVTVVLFGAAAFMTGQALAGTWRPYWQMIPYGLLLTAANRFFSWALFGGELLSLSGFVIDAIVLIVIGSVAYRLTRVYRMTTQYPWLYERAGLFSWRVRSGQ